MAEAKTKPTEISVEAFIAAVEPASKREDAPVLDALFRKVTGEAARMWGPTIVGYGEYSTVYDSGRQVRICRTGFSPRKVKHSLYISCSCNGAEDPRFTEMLGRLGKHSRGDGGCLYVNKLADIDLEVLEEMIALGWRNSLATYPD
jgi:hypothetical protein